MMDEPVWRGWRYKHPAESKTAFERIQRRLSRYTDDDGVTAADIGLWRSVKPDRSEFYIIAAGDVGVIEWIEDSTRPGVPWVVPTELRGPLWTRHVATVLTEYDRSRKVQVDVVQNHGGGLFLHRDGRLHPFPEPQGQG